MNQYKLKPFILKSQENNTMKTENKTKKKTVKKGNSKVTESDLEEKRNITWERNQKLLQETYIKLLQLLKRCPTISEVAQEVNLSVKTIKLHIKELKFEPTENPLRILTPDVLASIYSSARKGSAQSQKLWMQIMEGWKEKSEMEHSGGIKVLRDTIANKLKEKNASD